MITCRTLSALLWLAISWTVLVGCAKRPLEEPQASISQETVRYFPQTVEKDVDLLFVIDNSPSMWPIQNNLKQNFPQFIEALRSASLGAMPGTTLPCTPNDTRGCRIPNVHIGVVSTDMGAGHITYVPTCACQPDIGVQDKLTNPISPVCRVPAASDKVCTAPAGNPAQEGCDNGDGGRLRNTPGKQMPANCALPNSGWIEYTETETETGTGTGKIVTNIKNASSLSEQPIQQLEDAFSCIALLGDGACGFEQPLESARAALRGCQYSNGDAGNGLAKCTTNPGFIRRDAYLAIVFITNEDDCSTPNPDQLFNMESTGTNPIEARCANYSYRCGTVGPGHLLDNTQPKENCVPAGDWMYKVEDYAKFFGGLKPPGRTIVFAIAGPTGQLKVSDVSGKRSLVTSCGQENDVYGYAAIRLASMVKAFGSYGHFNEGLVVDTNGKEQKKDLDICASDFSPALRYLGKLVRDTIGGQCISAPPLTTSGGIACQAGDQLADGVTCSQSCLAQADCTVEEQVNDGPAEVVPRCSAELFDPAKKKEDYQGSKCWRIVPNTKNCDGSTSGSIYSLEILRSGDAAKGTVAKISCQSATHDWGSSEFGKLAQCQPSSGS